MAIISWCSCSWLSFLLTPGHSFGAGRAVPVALPALLCWTTDCSGFLLPSILVRRLLGFPLFSSWLLHVRVAPLAFVGNNGLDDESITQPPLAGVQVFYITDGSMEGDVADGTTRQHGVKVTLYIEVGDKFCIDLAPGDIVKLAAVKVCASSCSCKAVPTVCTPCLGHWSGQRDANLRKCTLS